MRAKKRFLVVAPLALTMVAGLNTQANAVTLHWSSRTYSDGFSAWSSPLDRCVTLAITGQVQNHWWLKQPNTAARTYGSLRSS